MAFEVLESGDTIPDSAWGICKALAYELRLEAHDMTDPGGAVFRDPPGGGAGVTYWRSDPATHRMREVDPVTAGTGTNDGDWDWASPTAHHDALEDFATDPGVEAKIADHTVTAAETGTTFTNEGAAGLITFSLPPAAADLKYTFVVHAPAQLKILAGAADVVRIAEHASAPAGYAISADVGSAVTLLAINGTDWVAISALGIWTVV